MTRIQLHFIFLHVFKNNPKILHDYEVQEHNIYFTFDNNQSFQRATFLSIYIVGYNEYIWKYHIYECIQNALLWKNSFFFFFFFLHPFSHFVVSPIFSLGDNF